jgi:hypothetical protein
MDITLDLFGKIDGLQLTLLTRCPSLTRWVHHDRTGRRGTGDGGWDSESWIHYSVPEVKGR